jgi:hypothetical protein
MEFGQAIENIQKILKAIGTEIDIDDYDGLIVKRLEPSNTLDSGRTTKQSHIAITGAQMDMFPYVRADGYFEVDYENEDVDLKKYFVAQIPAYLHKENVDYLGENMLITDKEQLVHISIVRSRRNNAADQIQMSMTYMDSPKFIEFRRNVHAGSYLIILKRTKALIYDIYAVKQENIKSEDADLSKMNNIFCKDKTNTVVKLDEILVCKNEDVCGCSKDDITPEWFKEKEKEFPTLDEDANSFATTFRSRFSPQKLIELSGVELLNTIFLNKNNKSNLCYILEFDSDCRRIYGSIKSGTSYKYGLHYSQKNKSWATGTGRNPQFLTEEEAIELGTQIRDNLIAGAELIHDIGAFNTLEEYQKLYDDLCDVTDGYINRVWFVKYYAILYPNIFPPIYSTNAQNTVLNKLSINPGNNVIYRIGQIRNYVDKCNISNVVFSRIFWTFCNNDDNKEDEIQEIEEKNKLKNCLEIVREPRTNKVHPLNFIVYGAPGTGKTYSMVEYALSIIDGVSIDDFRKSNTDRKTNVSRYKELVKVGQIVFTTFHQNYGYEEFIQGLRPDKDSETMAFKTVDGVFKVIADTALNDTENKNYVIIIDEINRANISKVFGELITLIEEDKRWGELNETSATLQSGDQFAVPNNLYIVGTMNSADKSISLIDAALRRRFDFIEQKPDSALVPEGVLRKMFDNINENLVSELDSTDLLVGHSYFMKKTEKDLCNILNNNIIPLLYEYFYDNRKKVAKLLNDAIDKSGAQIEIVDEKVGRLRVKDKVE